MSIPQVYQARFNEDGSAYVMARVKRKDASHNQVIHQQTDYASPGCITFGVYLTDGTVVVATAILATATVVLNSLSTGDLWTKDAIGFNFIHLVPKTSFPDATDYRLEYYFTLSGGESWPLIIEGEAIGLFGS